MNELLKNLDAAVIFRPEEGPFRAALAEIVLADADEDRVELFSASNCDIRVTIFNRTLEEGVIRFLVVSDLGEQSLECELAGLNVLESADFREQLSRHVAQPRPASAGGGAKVIVRKASAIGMYTQQQAAEKLACSVAFLKSRIPCTDYSYDEIDGKKVLKEYYWSQLLIDRLQQIKTTGTKPEDVKYIAAECCYGDSIWAEEMLTSLRPKIDGSGTAGMKNRSSRYPSKRSSNHHSEAKKLN